MSWLETTYAGTHGRGYSEMAGERNGAPRRLVAAWAGALAFGAAACGSGDLTLPDDSAGAGEQPLITIVDHGPSPSNVGRAVRFRVALGTNDEGKALTGEFEIRSSGGEGCTGNHVDLQCEIVFDAPGAHTVAAHYAAPGISAVSEPVTQQVDDVPFPTRTIIGVGPDPSPPGAPVTVWITVRGEGGAPARGRVEVYGPGTSACGEGPHAGGTELDAQGQGRITVTGLPVGWHYFRGCFTGSPGFSPSEDGASVTIAQLGT